MKRIAFFIAMFFPILILSQNPINNQIKYWYYRDRLHYFVMPGSNNGQSIVSDIRNRDAGADFYSSISFGQEWTQMGMYIGMLATEYKLLHDNNQLESAQNTLIELNLALDALIRLDKCEYLEPWNFSTEYFDGFYIRNDVSQKLPTKLTRRKLKSQV